MDKRPLEIHVESGNLVVLKFAGDLTKEALAELKQEILAGEVLIKQAWEQAGRKVRVLIDMSEFTGEYDGEGMQLMTEFARANKNVIAKTACFGGNAHSIIAGEMVAALADRDNIHFFRSRTEALVALGDGR